jgi:hypothetical protein
LSVMGWFGVLIFVMALSSGGWLLLGKFYERSISLYPIPGNF